MRWQINANKGGRIMKIKVSKNGNITMTAEKDKPGELTKWFKGIAEEAKKSTQKKKGEAK